MTCHENKKPSGKAGKCDDGKCNPFMACASGNFYMMEKGINAFALIPTSVDKLTGVNDNRSASCLSDCWHPPEDV
jgi:hypothetical protein